MKMFLDDYVEIPFNVIRVMCGEINYGGRITDDKDRRLINNLLMTFICEDVLQDGYSFSESNQFVVPENCEKGRAKK